MFTWNPDATPDPLDLPLPLRDAALDDDHLRLAAARGCVFGVLFSLPFWAALAAAGWVLAGIRFP